MSKKILITSEKNNIGKSLTAIRIAGELVGEGKKVIIVEMVESTNSLAKYMDLEEVIIYDLKDVFEGVCDIDQALLTSNSGINLLPTPRLEGKLGNVDKLEFNNLIEKLNLEYDYIIVEKCKIVKDYSIDFSVFDGAVILNSNELSSANDFNIDSVILKKSGINNIVYIVNKYSEKIVKSNKGLSIKDYNKMYPKEKIFFIDVDNKYENPDSKLFLTQGKDKLSTEINKIALLVK